MLTSTLLEIIEHVKQENQQRPHRPPLDALEVDDYIFRCVKACWHEDPDQRPDIRFVRLRLKEMQAGLKPNIFDNMLAIMEKYAYNLEGLVQERTNQLTEEKKKTDALLHRMLPKWVLFLNLILIHYDALSLAFITKFKITLLSLVCKQCFTIRYENLSDETRTNYTAVNTYVF